MIPENFLCVENFLKNVLKKPGKISGSFVRKIHNWDFDP